MKRIKRKKKFKIYIMVSEFLGEMANGESEINIPSARDFLVFKTMIDRQRTK